MKKKPSMWRTVGVLLLPIIFAWEPLFGNYTKKYKIFSSGFLVLFVLLVFIGIMSRSEDQSLASSPSKRVISSNKVSYKSVELRDGTTKTYPYDSYTTGVRQKILELKEGNKINQNQISTIEDLISKCGAGAKVIALLDANPMKDTLAANMRFVCNTSERKRKEFYIYENGKIKSERTFVNSKEEGSSRTWYSNGKLMTQVEFKGGKRDGVYTQWHENNIKGTECLYKSGKAQKMFTMGP